MSGRDYQNNLTTLARRLRPFLLNQVASSTYIGGGAGNFLAARYNTAAGQSIPSDTVTIVDFGTQDYDSHSAVTTGATWKFTVPAGAGGVYSVKATIMHGYTDTFAGSNLAELYLALNDDLVAVLDHYQPLTDGVFHSICLSGSTDYELSAGDEIDIRTWQTTSGALALINSAPYNHVSIHKVN